MPEWVTSLHASLLAVPLGLYIATFGVCFVSGFVPIVNAEVYLLAMAAVSPARTILPLTLAATFGQMTAKSLLHLAGRGVLRLPLGRHERRLRAVRERLEGHRASIGSLMFVSAFSGIPPFYVVSIVSGTLRVRFALFYVAGLAGRFLRFGVCVGLPQVVRALT